MPYPSLLHPEPLPLQQSTADPCLHKRHSNTVLSQSLWGLWVLVHTRFVWALWVSLAGMGVWFYMQFHPSHHLSRVSPLPLGMGYLRKIALALHSCYSSAYCLMGLPFGCGVFPHSYSSTTQPLIQLIVLGSKITADGDCSPEIKMVAPWKKSCDQTRQNIKKQRYYFPQRPT